MSDSNSAEVDQETTAKNISNKDKRKEPKAKRQRTDINERVLTDPFRRLSTMKDMRILMVGLDGAGKTTILYKLGGENVRETVIPGYYCMETLVYDKITLKAWDVSDINERVLTDPFRRLSTMKAMSILMVGLDGAGKSTILNKLGGENVSKTDIPGCYIETLVYNNITLKAWDVSGEFETTLQGSNSLKDTKGLIIVVDSTDKGRLAEAKYKLFKLLNENTCATSGAGLYEGLNWLSKKVKYTFDTSLEGVSEGLNRLRASSANKKYDDMPSCITSQPTDKELVQFLVRLIDGKDIYPDRVGRVNLFENHPAETSVAVAISFPVCMVLPNTICSTARYPMMQYVVNVVITHFKIKPRVSGNRSAILSSFIVAFLTEEIDMEKYKHSAKN
ncbi:ADP-ribosylation factor 1 [Artemisia annua]|uniref:ADP-ribosylation factor 1 n=1 Tax=Artemisia annua TaxID=35608 RepID=A0A2U1LWT8_ARTAN|nr:ADP-ribosylation factor 1 [Artemisia annua]